MAKKIKVAIMIFLIFLTGISLCFSSGKEHLPVPGNIVIHPPDPSLPDEAKLLSGKWSGQWWAKWPWDCILYVEKVDKDYVQVVHSWGEYSTSKMTCHCSPNWARVLKAKVTYSEGKATIDFITPNYETGHFKKKNHVLSGEDEGWKGTRGGHGHYNFSFTIEKSEPDILKGHFISGKGSHLYIKLKKTD